MNTNQKNVLIGTSVILAIMILFPPFIYSIGGVHHNFGYSFLFKPPIFFRNIGNVNAQLLFVQILGVGAIGFILFHLFKHKK
jgi:hypothetical protein